MDQNPRFNYSKNIFVQVYSKRNCEIKCLPTKKNVPNRRIELMTFALLARRSNQLS